MTRITALTDKVIAYESGEMDEDEVVEFFQMLVDTGLAWSLQGSYGRTAAALIEDGRVTTAPPPHAHREWTECTHAGDDCCAACHDDE